MVGLGFAVMWVGYQQLFYGWVLMKGYDIRWRDLATPIHPYQWPPRGQKIPLVPKGQILPGQPNANASAQTTAKSSKTSQNQMA